MSSIIAAILAGLFSLAAVAYTVWSGQRAKRTQDAVEKVRADGEAYERAQMSYRKLVEDLERQVDRLNLELTALRIQLRTEESRSDELDAKVDTLQTTVNRMRALLTSHDIAIPAWEAS